MSTTQKINWSGNEYHLLAVIGNDKDVTYARLGYWGGDYRWHVREAVMFDGDWTYVTAEVAA